jgi:hypothetical protein
MLITSFMSHVANATMLDKRRGRATQSSKPIIADLMLYSRDQSSSKIVEMSLAAAETRPMQ